MQSKRVIKALSALAHEHRLAAFRLLVKAGHMGVAAGVLAEKLDLPPSSMSFHLAQLSNAGLVTQQRESRSIYYAADFAAMTQLLAYLTQNCCAGLDRADADCAVEGPKKDRAP